MRRLLLGLMIVLAVVVGHPRGAAAAPMHTALTTVRTEAQTVVIGTMKKGVDLVVDVDTVVYGSSPLGPRKLTSSPDGSSYSEGRVVVFIDQAGTFRWVGHLVAGPRLETGVIQLSGFFDFNAHLVGPGLMTLAQLKDFFATGTLAQKFIANVTVEDPTAKGAYVPSGHRMTFDYEAVSGAVTNFVGFTPAECLDSGRFVSHLDWGSLSVALTGDCPIGRPQKQSRDVTFEGNFTGVDAATGAITADVSPVRPFLDAKDFPKFLADPTISSMTQIVNVRLADGTEWKWEIGSSLTDGNGKKHEATGTSSRSGTVNGVQTQTLYYDFEDQTKLAFTNGPNGTMSPGGYAPTILAGIDRGNSGACELIVPNRANRSCTVVRGHSVVVKR